MKTIWKILFGAILVLIVLYFMGCIQSSTEKKVDLKNKIEILSINSKWLGEGAKYIWINGEFKNNTGQVLKAVEIQGVSYDKENNILSTQKIYEKNLGIGEIRAFEIPLDYIPGNASYKVRVTNIFE